MEINKENVIKFLDYFDFSDYAEINKLVCKKNRAGSDYWIDVIIPIKYSITEHFVALDKLKEIVECLKKPWKVYSVGLIKEKEVKLCISMG